MAARPSLIMEELTFTPHDLNEDSSAGSPHLVHRVDTKMPSLNKSDTTAGGSFFLNNQFDIESTDEGSFQLSIMESSGMRDTSRLSVSANVTKGGNRRSTTSSSGQDGGCTEQNHHSRRTTNELETTKSPSAQCMLTPSVNDVLLQGSTSNDDRNLPSQHTATPQAESNLTSPDETKSIVSPINGSQSPHIMGVGADACSSLSFQIFVMMSRSGSGAPPAPITSDMCRAALLKSVHHNLITTTNSISSSNVVASVPLDAQTEIITNYLLNHHTPGPPMAPMTTSPRAHQHLFSASTNNNTSGGVGDTNSLLGGGLHHHPSTPSIRNALDCFKAFDGRMSAGTPRLINTPGGGELGSAWSCWRPSFQAPTIASMRSGGGAPASVGDGSFSSQQGGMAAWPTVNEARSRSSSIPTPQEVDAFPSDWTATDRSINHTRAPGDMKGTDITAIVSRPSIPFGGMCGFLGSPRFSMSNAAGGFSATGGSVFGGADVPVINELKAGEEVSTGFDMINDYIVWDQISSGSQGATFEVIDTRGGGKRCMKVVRRDLILHRTLLNSNDSGENESERRMSTALGLRLHKEVAILKRLRHPNIVRLHEVIDDPTVNSVYMFMDLVDGGPLCKELPPATSPAVDHSENASQGSQIPHQNNKNRRNTMFQHRVSLRPGDGSEPTQSRQAFPLIQPGVPSLNTARFEPLSFKPLVRFAHQIAGGLRYLHRHGIVHRDVKPDNILIDNTTNKAVVVDFGVSESDSTDADPTVIVGGVAGTPAFVAPELWGGGPVSGVAADAWSLGVTLFVATVGFLPFVGGSTPELREAILTLPPKKFPTRWWTAMSVGGEQQGSEEDEGLYGEWEALVMGLLDKDPAKRTCLPQFLLQPIFVTMKIAAPRRVSATRKVSIVTSPTTVVQGGDNTPSPPLVPTPPRMPRSSIIKQGSPTRWARRGPDGELEASETEGLDSSGEEPDTNLSLKVVDETILESPSADELNLAIAGVRSHRMLSMVPPPHSNPFSNSIMPIGPPPSSTRTLPKGRGTQNYPQPPTSLTSSISSPKAAPQSDNKSD